MTAVAALVIFCGAFLLFVVEPLIGKCILPWFGGSPAVWTTAMLFFQAMLLAGYGYAHAVRARPGRGAARTLHLALLVASLAFLPITPSEAWKPKGSEDPTFHILALLGSSIGLPFTLLASTSPLVQSWSAAGGTNSSPYTLYAVSNVGSLLALVCYPLWIEPTLAVGDQSLLWSLGYTIFAVAFAALALRAPPSTPSDARDEATHSARDAWGLWLGLSATGSVLFLAVTNQLTLNVAPVPLLWVLPLGIYLLTFVLTFGSGRWYHRRWYLRAMAVVVVAMTATTASGRVDSLPLEVGLYAAGLFICCMICHGELAELRPPPSRLTAFYLAISAGGALGGLFVAVVAPRVFSDLVELPIALLATLLLPFLAGSRASQPPAWRIPAATIASGLALLFGGALWLQAQQLSHDDRFRARNFYGTLRVTDRAGDETIPRRRVMFHGSIEHGLQFLAPDLRRRGTTYYGPETGIGIALRNWRPRAKRRIGVIGLGVGTLATYTAAGDTMRFYEINPLVVESARRDFTFLADARGETEIVLADARLALEREADQRFDLLAADAFSSDAVPAHLLTVEAFRLYFRHLVPGGVLAVHVSNRYLDLAALVAATAQAIGQHCVIVKNAADAANGVYRTDWAFVTTNEEFLALPALRQAGAELDPTTATRPWTDAWTSLFAVLR